MKCNIYTWLLVCLICSFELHAQQRAEDILNYSTFGNYGSSRVQGVGGAMNAIGGDASLISTNPAAVAAFWKSEFSVGVGFDDYGISSSLNNGPTTTLNKNSFVLNHAAYVGTTVDLESNVMAWSWAVGFNKLGDFDREFSFTNTNSGSITEYWLARADGLAPNQFDNFQEGLAFDAQAIFINADDQYTIDYFDADPASPDLFHTQFVIEEGHNNEIFLSGGVNLNNKWLLGGSLNVPYFRYKTRREYFEGDPDDRVPAFLDLEYIEERTTSGFGVNLKVGAIYKANSRVRLSAAVHSPTYYNVSDEFVTDLRFAFTDPDNGQRVDSTYLSPFGEFNDYGAISAWRTTFGGAFLFGKRGFIDIEADYIGYGNSSFDFTSGDDSNSDDRLKEEIINDEVKDNFKNALNYRVGGELVLDAFRLRGGLQLLGSPYEELDDMGTGYSLGLGIRANQFYIDAAWSSQTIKRPYRPYALVGAGEQLVIQDIDQSQFSVTVGVKL